MASFYWSQPFCKLPLSYYAYSYDCFVVKKFGGKLETWKNLPPFYNGRLTVFLVVCPNVEGANTVLLTPCHGLSNQTGYQCRKDSKTSGNLDS